MWLDECLSIKKDKLLIDEIENWNLAGYRGTTHTKEKIRNPENLDPGGRNGGWNLILYICLQKLTHF
jgi:hypothetical protein